MTDNTPTPSRTLSPFALLAFILALIAVPFVGLILSAPWYWYLGTAAYLFVLSERL